MFLCRNTHVKHIENTNTLLHFKHDFYFNIRMTECNEETKRFSIVQLSPRIPVIMRTTQSRSHEMGALFKSLLLWWQELNISSHYLLHSGGGWLLTLCP